jgi:hypothetical protein
LKALSSSSPPWPASWAVSGASCHFHGRTWCLPPLSQDPQ